MEAERPMPADGDQQASVRRTAHLHRLYDSNPGCGLALSPEGTILVATARAAELLQVPRAALVGRPFADFVAPQERPLFARLLAETADAKSVSDELILRRPDQISIYASVALRLLPRPVGSAALGVVVVAMPHRSRFSERMRREKADLEVRVAERTADLLAANRALQDANRALAAQHAMSASILEQLPDALFVVDVDRRILLANSAACRLVESDPQGLPFEEARRRLGEFFAPDGRPIPPDEAAVLQALQGETRVAQEVLLLPPQGEKRVLLVNAIPLRDAGQALVGAVVHYADVTRLRQVVGEVPAALDTAEVLVREMRHRFRNNLAILAALLGLQSESVESPEAREVLEASRQRVYSMARLQDQLHLGDGREAIHMGAYLGGLATTLARSYGRPALHLTVKAEAVKLDTDRAGSLGLIVNELVTNAFKHAFPNGEQGEIGVSLSESGTEYRLCVWDTGRGILSDQGGEPSPSFGLRLVHLLVRRLGGTLALETAAGSRFTVTFPVTPPSAKA